MLKRKERGFYGELEGQRRPCDAQQRRGEKRRTRTTKGLRWLLVDKEMVEVSG